MLEDNLNPSKKETLKKDIIIQYDKERADYADMLKSIVSICDNNSDAADFNKKIHVNRYDEIKIRDNKNQISENIYEIVIGLPNKMDWCKEVSTYFGLHFCWLGKTAHIYVDEMHYYKSDIEEFEKYAARIETDFDLRTTKRSEKGMRGCAMVLWKPSAEGESVKEQFDYEAFERYVDIPGLFHRIFVGIGSFLRKVVRKIGFSRQNDIIKNRYKILIKDFYLHYLPVLIGEADAR
jgi:hypothetical protein